MKRVSEERVYSDRETSESDIKLLGGHNKRMKGDVQGRDEEDAAAHGSSKPV